MKCELRCGTRRAVMFLLALASFNALAEGRCPPGQFPVGGQGMLGCAPIPSSGGGAAASPQPDGRWIKTWGAISMAPNGASGTATGKLKKADATNAALSDCKATGASNCRVVFSYKNQCVAAAIATSGFSDTQFSTAAELHVADARAIQDCTDRGGRGCEVIYHACSDPYLQKY